MNLEQLVDEVRDRSSQVRKRRYKWERAGMLAGKSRDEKLAVVLAHIQRRCLRSPLEWYRGVMSMRMTEEQVVAHQLRIRGKADAVSDEPKPRTKFRNIRCEVDGDKFDSKLEARRFQALKFMEAAGEIRDLRSQVSFPLMAGDELIGAYVADAVYFDVRKNRKVVEDSKGCKTPLYRWKARHFKAQYGFSITEIKKA